MDRGLRAVVDHENMFVEEPSNLKLYITSIDLSGTNAAVTHASTGSILLRAGDIVTMQGLQTASLNRDWTVVGTPSDTTFFIAKSEHSVALTDLKTETGTATVHFVLDIHQVMIE